MMVDWRKLMSSSSYTVVPIFLVIVSLPLAFATYALTCPEWSGPDPTYTFTAQDGTMCYVFVEASVTWHTANSICSQQGWRLLKIPSQRINRFFEENLDFRHCFWIGLSDHLKEDEFRWTDGSLMTFGDVDKGFLAKWEFDCVAMCKIDFLEGFSWRAKACSNKLTLWDYVCETDPVAITTTTPSSTEVEQQRRTRKPTSLVMRRIHDDVKLTAKPLFSIKCPLVTTCIRECARRKPCSVVNFHKRTFVCEGHVPQALGEGWQRVTEWQVWVESN